MQMLQEAATCANIGRHVGADTRIGSRVGHTVSSYQSPVNSCLHPGIAHRPVQIGKFQQQSETFGRTGRGGLVDYQPTKGGVAREDVATKNEQYGKGKGRVDGARQVEYSTSASALVSPSHLGLGLGLGLLCLLLSLLLTLGIRLHLNLLLLSSTTISSISRRGVGDRAIEQRRASANHSNRSGLFLL